MAETTLPHWDMTPIFPSLESQEFAAAFQEMTRAITALGELWDRKEIRRQEGVALPPEEFAARYDEVTLRLNAVREQMRTLGSYVGCFVTTNARDEVALALDSQLDTEQVRLDQLFLRYVAWVGSGDVEGLLHHSAVARAHEFQVRRARTLAKHQMSEAEEALAAELQPSGLNGWARLHGNLTALLTATVTLEAGERVLPMSSVRALASDPNREVRREAFEAELKAWETAALPIAAALNGIKGFQLTVRRRRGWPDDLSPTLLANSIDRETLDAMQQACIESFPDFRRYMDSRARLLGLDHLAWYDLSAPVGAMRSDWTWQAAEEFIRDNFGRYSSRMADFADQAFRQQWIDAEPRVGKEGGAYCTGIRPGESRVMMNFDGSFNSVSTLAHELGHAYHNFNLRERTSLQRGTPSTLAETASIFCETLSFNAAYPQADREERLALLDNSLQKDLMVVVDIHSRFLFESGVFERRGERDLTISESNQLMLAAQRETYGDRLEPLHPYMWAVKGHYYGPTFYNYPYTFGLLFGLGLYARYQQDPESFRRQYDEFLSLTGLLDARALGRRFEIDVASIDFWRTSLDVIRGEIREFETLASGAGS